MDNSFFNLINKKFFKAPQRIFLPPFPLISKGTEAFSCQWFLSHRLRGTSEYTAWTRVIFCFPFSTAEGIKFRYRKDFLHLIKDCRWKDHLALLVRKSSCWSIPHSPLSGDRESGEQQLGKDMKPKKNTCNHYIERAQLETIKIVQQMNRLKHLYMKNIISCLSLTSFHGKQVLAPNNQTSF